MSILTVLKASDVTAIALFVADEFPEVIKAGSEARIQSYRDVPTRPEIVATCPVKYDDMKVVFVDKNFSNSYSLLHHVEISSDVKNLTQIQNFVENCRENARLKMRARSESQLCLWLLNGDAVWCVSNVIAKRSLQSVCLENRKQIENIHDFMLSKNTNCNRVSKLVVLLHGENGTGKSALATAIASHYDHDVAEFDAARIKFDFSTVIRRLPDKCILLIEDIDSLYDNQSKNQDVLEPYTNFCRGLRCLSEVGHVLIIMTATKIDRLGLALRRKIDMLIELPLLRKVVAEQLFRIWRPKMDEDTLLQLSNRTAALSCAPTTLVKSLKKDNSETDFDFDQFRKLCDFQKSLKPSMYS